MDTTIRNLDAEAYRRIKARAALEGRTLGEAVSEAIRRYVEAEEGPAPPPAPGYYAGEVAEPGPGGGAAEAGARAAGGEPEAAERAALEGPPPPPAPPIESLLARLAELGRPDRELLDELEAIQAAQPRLGPGRWES